MIRCTYFQLEEFFSVTKKPSVSGSDTSRPAVGIVKIPDKRIGKYSCYHSYIQMILNNNNNDNNNLLTYKAPYINIHFHWSIINVVNVMLNVVILDIFKHNLYRNVSFKQGNHLT